MTSDMRPSPRPSIIHTLHHIQTSSRMFHRSSTVEKPRTTSTYLLQLNLTRSKHGPRVNSPLLYPLPSQSSTRTLPTSAPGANPEYLPAGAVYSQFSRVI